VRESDRGEEEIKDLLKFYCCCFNSRAEDLESSFRVGRLSSPNLLMAMIMFEELLLLVEV